MPGCKFVYFDAGFTLLKPSPSVGYWYAEVAREFGVESDGDAIDGAFSAAWKENRKRVKSKRKLPYGINREEAIDFWTPVVKDSFEFAGYKAPKSREFFERVFDEFALAKCWELYPEAQESIDFLKSCEIGVGILSNWDSRLRGVLFEMGLDRQLDAIVLSCEVGLEKPNKEIFDFARKAAKVPKGVEIGMIGDEFKADGYGALDAGWDQCIIWRHEGEPPSDLLCSRSLLDATKKLVSI